MKKLICIAMCIFMLVLSSCVVKPEEDDITGDVKDKTQVSVDGEHDKAQVPEIEDEKHKAVPEITSAVTAEALISKMGAYAAEPSENYNKVQIFAEAVKNADTETVAEYAMGKEEYYDFLKNVTTTSYKIYPFEFSPEKNTELVGKEIYNVYNEKFLVEFEVAESSSEDFPKGSCVYYLELNDDEALGNIIEYFVPAEYAVDLYTDPESKREKGNFIKEMLAIYGQRLYEGENYPASFDFSKDDHLITHLMAWSGFYAETPPYSLNEINEFIRGSFDGNEGISLKTEDEIGFWLFYGTEITNEAFEEQKLFGCPFAHGGTHVVYTIDKKAAEGNMIDYYVTTYADYSHFAPAKKMVFTFEENENVLQKLMLINVSDDFDRETVGLSF